MMSSAQQAAVSSGSSSGVKYARNLSTATSLLGEPFSDIEDMRRGSAIEEQIASTSAAALARHNIEMAPIIAASSSSFLRPPPPISRCDEAMVGLGKSCLELKIKNPETAVEYFCYALGKSNFSGEFSSSSSFTASSSSSSIHENNLLNHMSTGKVAKLGRGLSAAMGERFSIAIELLLSKGCATEWPELEKCKLRLLSAFNYYLLNEPVGALECLLLAYKNNQIVQMIERMDHYRLKYGWDKRLCFLPFRTWLQSEYEDILEQEAEDHYPDDFNENEEEEGDGDAVREMLGYLLQLL